MPRRSYLALGAAVLVTLGLQGSASPTPSPGFLGAFRWTISDPLFGGFSAIDLDDGGVAFTAISDKGAFIQGRLIRESDGRISAIEAGSVTRLKSNQNRPLAGMRSDSEGLAIAPDGSVYVSFEGVSRVLRYPRIDGLAQNLPTPQAFRAFPENAALEALAVDAQGTLYTFPEELTESKTIRLLTGEPGNPDGADFPVWRYSEGVWSQPFALPRSGAFLPVSADFGPDGRLYVLERTFHGIAGFSSRVRSFRVGETALSDATEHLQSHAGLHDNLEGMSVWRDKSGAIRLTLISDDNFMPFQRTEIVEYRLTD